MYSEISYQKFPELWMELSSGSNAEFLRKVDQKILEEKGAAFYELSSLRGFCSFSMGHYSEAKRQFQVVMEDRPEFKSCLALGVCATLEGDWRMARRAFEKAVKIEEEKEFGQENLFVKYYLCRVCLEERDFTFAEKYLEEIFTEFKELDFLDEWELFLRGLPFWEQILWLAKDVWTRKGDRTFSKVPFQQLAESLCLSGKRLTLEWLDSRRQAF